MNAPEPRPELRRWKLAAAAVVVMVLAFQTAAAFNRPIEGDYVAYGLPAANFIKNGRLATPGVGTQYALDRYWRFNSPLIAAGSLPFMAVFGVNHGAYLVGVVVEMMIGVGVYLLLLRRAAPASAWCVVALAAAAFLLTRIYLGELYNQRYTIVAYASVGCLFFPHARTERASAWRWALAGILPLVHPSLLLGSVVWVLAENGAVGIRFISRVGLAALLAGVGLCAAWYLDPEPLRTQFLPHLRSRSFAPLSGWLQPASPVASIPSQMVMALTVVGALVWAATGPRDRVVGGRRVVALLGLAIVLDCGGYMYYLSYFAIGLGPAVLRLWAGTATQRWLLAAFAALGVANILVEVKLAGIPVPHTPASAGELEGFVREHTMPGDVIVLGPPFTFQLLTHWDDRQAQFVVPMPLYLADFDQAAYLWMLQGSTIYVGFPEYFDAVQLYYRPTSPPVFEPARIATIQFRGRAVIVARPYGPDNRGRAR